MVHQFIRLCVIGIGLGGALSSTWGMEKNSYPSIPQSIGSKVGQDNFKGSIIDFLSQKKQEAFLDEKGFKIEGRNIVKKTTNESLSLLELRSLSPDSYNSWLASKQQALQKQLEGSVLANNKAAYATS